VDDRNPTLIFQSVSGSVKIDYGHLPEEEDATTSRPTFYSRRLILPVLFTVQPALRCTSVRVIPFPNKAAPPASEEQSTETNPARQPLATRDSGFRRNRQEDDRFRTFLRNAASSDRYSSAQMTMFNPSDYALECIMECKDVESDEGVMVRRLVAPGATER
jgi:hypothetical protein